MNLVLDDTIRIPVEFDELDDFRSWTRSGNYPNRGDYFYLSGDLWIDLSMETLLHNQIKGLFNIILGAMLLDRPLGLYFGDRMRLVNVEADISCEPDGMFISHKSNQSGRATWEQGAESLEVIGSPDMVLEIVSAHTIQKDTVVLRDLYARAEIPEYWLVNPLGGKLSFDILRRTTKGYTPVRKVGGWLKSAVFGKSFRLTPQKIGDDLPQCRLHVR
jgi:Uma2 family endonuclease